jgi:crossover junction endodeoxyribonuclease RuvC
MARKRKARTNQIADVILGLDPGIANFGWAVYSTDDLIKEYGVIKSNPQYADHQRMLQIVEGVDLILKRFEINCAVIEQMMLNTTIPGIIRGYGARMCVLVHLTGNGIPFEEYNPTTTKKSLLGKGVAEKKTMKSAVLEWFQLKPVGKGALAEHAIDSFAQIAMYLKEGKVDCSAYDIIKETIDNRRGNKCLK